MSANTQMLAHCGSYYGRSANVSVDGSQTGTFAALPVGEYIVSGWAATGVGAISAGTHMICRCRFQPGIRPRGTAFFFMMETSAPAALPACSRKNFGGVTSYWAGATMVPSNRPIISSGSVTPSFNVSGALGANYYVNFNGTVSTYVPGTAITQAGIIQSLG